VLALATKAVSHARFRANQDNVKSQIFVSLAISTCLAGCLQAQVSAPELGIVRYADNTVRPIYGVEANLIVGKQLFPFADAVSFSEFGGLVAAKGHIRLISRRGSLIREYYTNERKPLLNVDGALTTAIAYLPSREALLHWSGKSFVLTQLDAGSFPGTPTSVQMHGAHSARLLATTAHGTVSEITISLDTGQLTSVKFLPGIRGPAFLQQSFVLFRDKQGLEIEAPDGNRRTVSVPSRDFTVERMSSDWLHLTSPSTQQSWVLHLNSSALQLSEMPVSKAEARR
jgi:hypothetical protein